MTARVITNRLRRTGRGFTLVEILVVLAIMALILGSFSWGGAFRIDREKKSTGEIFWEAVRKAREKALLDGREVQLLPPSTRAEISRTLTLVADGEVLTTWPLPTGEGASSLQFLMVETDKAVSLIGGVVSGGKPLARVRFYSDGTCQPFRAEVRNARGTEVWSVDPWTCAPILPQPSPRVR